MTFEEVQKYLKDNGLNFSDADLELARKNPEAGMTIANYQIDYRNSKTDDQRALAHAGADKTRRDYGGYTGGDDGSKYYLAEPSPMSYKSDEFKNPYAEQRDSLMNSLMNREQFSYDPNSDPLFQSYRQMNLREADRATQNTLGQAAAMTGGMPSTAAINAASQAGDYYRAQINDALPQFADSAYQKHIDELGLDFDTLSALNSLSQQKRDEYDTDRNFAYNQWTDELGFQSDKENTALENERYKTEYGDAMTMDMYNLLMSNYEATGNADSLKRAMAILTALQNGLNS